MAPVKEYDARGCKFRVLVVLGLEKSPPARGKLPLAKISKLGGKGLWILW